MVKYFMIFLLTLFSFSFCEKENKLAIVLDKKDLISECRKDKNCPTQISFYFKPLIRIPNRDLYIHLVHKSSGGGKLYYDHSVRLELNTPMKMNLFLWDLTKGVKYLYDIHIVINSVEDYGNRKNEKGVYEFNKIEELGEFFDKLFQQVNVSY